jgi:thiamine kinase-like enzyme
VGIFTRVFKSNKAILFPLSTLYSPISAAMNTKPCTDSWSWEDASPLDADDETDDSGKKDVAKEVSAASKKHLQLVLGKITEHAGDDEYPTLALFGKGMEKGQRLRIDELTGGVTNCSYRIWLENSGDSDATTFDPELHSAVFAKLGFNFAFWNGSRSSYNPVRLNNELQGMELFSSVAPGLTPTPYFVETIPGVGSLFIAEYLKQDEQLANQWIEGSVDPRPLRKLATALASFHCLQAVDKEFNTNVRKTSLELMHQLGKEIVGLAKREPADRVSALAASFGEDVIAEIYRNTVEDYTNTRDCLVHADPHGFNLLVEPKAGVDAVFGAEGSISLVDWEMCIVGPVGRDVGIFLPFPIAAVLAHTRAGNFEGALAMRVLLADFWEIYQAALLEGGKSEQFVRHAFVNSVAWCGWFMYLLVSGGFHFHLLQYENDGDFEAITSSLAMIGLKSMKIGFTKLPFAEEFLTLGELKSNFWSMVDDEMSALSGGERPLAAEEVKRPARRSSLLRQETFKVSDSEFNGGELMEGACAGETEVEDKEKEGGLNEEQWRGFSRRLVNKACEIRDYLGGH